jgi:hypothetical protein
MQFWHLEKWRERNLQLINFCLYDDEFNDVLIKELLYNVFCIGEAIKMQLN